MQTLAQMMENGGVGLLTTWCLIATAGWLWELFRSKDAFSPTDLLGKKPKGDKDEAYYQRLINNILQGQLEFRLDDGTRVDILTDYFAVEVDWAHKWYEGLGQAFHYGLKTQKIPMVCLIVRSKSDEKYVERAIDGLRNTRCNINGMNYTPGLLVYRDYL